MQQHHQQKGGDQKYKAKAKKPVNPPSWDSLYAKKPEPSLQKQGSEMVDDAILSIEETTKPSFTNSKKTTNKKPKERELTKTHQSWVENAKNGSSLNELMKTEGGSYD